MGGFNIDNYIDGSGEVKVRFLSSAPVSQYYLYLDSLYIMVGTVNTDTSKCEISLGSGTQVDCANTRDVKEATTVVPTTSTFGVNSVLGFPANRWPLDDDNDATSDQNVGLNISFPVELASNMKVTGIHYAAKYNAGSTSATIDVQVRDYSGISGTSGWNNVPGVTTTSGNTYVFNDS